MDNMDIMISRVYSGPEGTFGVLHDFQGVPFALTAERPWAGNMRNVSCIPSGEYICERVQSPRFGETFEVTNVRNRNGILFHKGNIPLEDSQGCILIGEMFEPIGGRMAVQTSAKGFREFMLRLRGKSEFYLKITNHWNF